MISITFILVMILAFGFILITFNNILPSNTTTHVITTVETICRECKQRGPYR